MTPVAMVTNIRKFEYKVNVIGLHDSKTANVNVKNLTV